MNRSAPPMVAPRAPVHHPHQPPPASYGPPAGRPYAPMVRPVGVAASAVMTIAASTTWLAALAGTWLGARHLRAYLDPKDAGEQALSFLLQRYDETLVTVWPTLVGAPLLALLVAFRLPRRGTGPRGTYTLLGLATIGGLLWWLGDLWWAWAAPVTFIGFALLLVWTPAARRWFNR